MAQRKTERLMNLIFTLLATNQYLTKAQIREAIADYRDSSQLAFERKFERDKEELRDLGLDIETGSFDPSPGNELGYRIQRSAVELPDIELTPEEAAVIGLAAQVWEHSGMAAQSSTVLTKLKAIGNDIDTGVLQMPQPRLTANEPSFDALFDAATRRVPVRFDYRARNAEVTSRHVQPWGLISWRDRWYLGGFDVDRQAPRIFRLSRIDGDVAPSGEPGSYDVPSDVDMRSVAAAMFEEPRTTAKVRVAAGRGQALRRRAVASRSAGDGFDELDIRYWSIDDLARDIASYAEDAHAVSPPQLRDAVIAQLRAAAGESA